jgi:hypothetical protein
MDVRKRTNLDDILWTPPYPSFAPFIHTDDITALYTLQMDSFAPASTHYIDPQNGRLAAIKVYSPLGYCAGITGIGFVYDTGVERTWGSVDNAASLVFFLDGVEQLSRVKVYKENSLAYHLQVRHFLLQVFS